MSNISLVKWFRAENPTGLKPNTEATDTYGGRRSRPLVSLLSARLAGLGVSSLGLPGFLPYAVRLVGERSAVGRREIARTPGRSGSENAGMSSEKWSENLHHRKPKVS